MAYTRDEYFDTTGKPTFVAKTKDAISVDFLNQKVYRSTSTTVAGWSEETNVNIRNFYLKTKGDKGDKGDPGTPGTGTGVSPYIIVVGTGNDDTAINAALAEQRATRKKIVLVGNITTSEISIPMDQYSGCIEGYGAIWNIRQSANSGLKRVQPINNKQALDFFTTARFTITGVTFRGYQHQICLDLGASYMSAYRDCNFENFKTAIHLRFALRTTIQNCMTTNCLNGFLVDIGNWPDASYTASNSQSNQTKISECRIQYQIPNASGEVAIGIYGCSGFVAENNIIEGGKYKKMYDKDFKMCANDKDFTVKNTHSEPVYGNLGSGSGEAYIYIRLVGTATIDGVYSQYGGCFIDAGGEPGELNLDIMHISWLVKDVNQKLFNNAGGTRWFFHDNSYQSLLNNTSLSSVFTGKAVTLCASGNGCLPNTYSVSHY